MPWLWKRKRHSYAQGEIAIPAPDEGRSLAALSRRLRDLEASHERALLSLEVTLQDVLTRQQLGNSGYESRLQGMEARVRQQLEGLQHRVRKLERGAEVRQRPPTP